MSVDDASAALSEVRYTLMILGTQGASGPHFMVGNWGVQASFDPWRFVFMLKKSAHTLANAQKHGAFTVNLLSEGHDHKGLVQGIMKGKGQGHKGEKGTLDAPRLPEAYAGLDCKVLQTVDVGGDHLLVVAEVVDGWKKGEGPAVVLADLDLSYAG
jgi:flavin reductase (DIM6/NTAB) family NADH-FMN oxidoreductase RutF